MRYSDTLLCYVCFYQRSTILLEAFDDSKPALHGCTKCDEIG